MAPSARCGPPGREKRAASVHHSVVWPSRCPPRHLPPPEPPKAAKQETMLAEHSGEVAGSPTALPSAISPRRRWPPRRRYSFPASHRSATLSPPFTPMGRSAAPPRPRLGSAASPIGASREPAAAAPWSPGGQGSDPGGPETPADRPSPDRPVASDHGPHPPEPRPRPGCAQGGSRPEAPPKV